MCQFLTESLELRPRQQPVFLFCFFKSSPATPMCKVETHGPKNRRGPRWKLSERSAVPGPMENKQPPRGPSSWGRVGEERKNGAVSIVISRLLVIKNLRLRATGETSIQIFYPYGLLLGLLLGYHPQYIQHIGLSREY